MSAKRPTTTFVIPVRRAGRLLLSSSGARFSVIVERWDAIAEGQVLEVEPAEVWATLRAGDDRRRWHTTVAGALSAACRDSVMPLTHAPVGPGLLARPPILPTRPCPFPRIEVRERALTSAPE